ncbi:hypothetical protein DPEC_G00100150 [Dallia pectoralis]|uniref:Uncharacterized protein n=1 Tax=Dallia pectoralis TaxID=75939 RepID=A0ACC2GWF8_DALPE|nr:hypothetical protein DPEC_G00100150 [Dallia pectoralis]
MWWFIFTAFCTLISNVLPETLPVSAPEGPVLVRLGRVATLPCWLTQSLNAEGLEVRWYRVNGFDKPVLLYLDRRIQDANQPAEYAGRTSLGLREAKSQGLKGGDVTLELVNVTRDDQGPYTCYVSSDQGYGSATVHLRVNVLGTPPLLSAVRMENGSVNVSCVSHGWQPRPQLKWSDGTRTLPGITHSDSGAQGLVSVRSWLLTPSVSSHWVSCSVSLPEEEEREGRVDLHNVPKMQVDSSGSLRTAVIILVLLLLTGAIIFGVLYWKRGGKIKSILRPRMEEMQPLLSTVSPLLCCVPIADDDAMRFNAAVDVTLDLHDLPPYLKANSELVRDNIDYKCPSDEHSYVLGTPGFKQGQCAYWEVGLGDTTLGIKESWWVGVASGSVSRKAPATPKNGFWYLSSDRKSGLQLNTAPGIHLPALPRPQTLGVYLDYDKGELSFISVEEKRLIVTVATVFTGEVFPLFNPGTNDKAPMKILNISVSKREDPKSPTPTSVEESKISVIATHPNSETSEAKHGTVS